MYLKKKVNVLVLYILADLISFLEIKRLQLAGSSSTVFAVNLILFFTAAILLCAVRDAQCKTRESP